jgi:hypothetical protein
MLAAIYVYVGRPLGGLISAEHHRCALRRPGQLASSSADRPSHRYRASLGQPAGCTNQAGKPTHPVRTADRVHDSGDSLRRRGQRQANRSPRRRHAPARWPRGQAGRLVRGREVTDWPGRTRRVLRIGRGQRPPSGHPGRNGARTHWPAGCDRGPGSGCRSDPCHPGTTRNSSTASLT